MFTPNPHFSQVQALKMVHEKNWRVSLCVQELCHPQDFLRILGLTVLDGGLRFDLVWDFWLA